MGGNRVDDLGVTRIASKNTRSEFEWNRIREPIRESLPAAPPPHVLLTIRAKYEIFGQTHNTISYVKYTNSPTRFKSLKYNHNDASNVCKHHLWSISNKSCYNGYRRTSLRIIYGLRRWRVTWSLHFHWMIYRHFVTSIISIKYFNLLGRKNE